jgi:hypothetical protein
MTPSQGLYLHRRTHKTIALPSEIISQLIPVIHSVTLFPTFNGTRQTTAVLKTAVPPQEPDESSTSNFIYILLVLLTFKRSNPSVSLSARKTTAKRDVSLSSHLSVCPLTRNNSAPTGRIFVKFYIWGF